MSPWLRCVVGVAIVSLVGAVAMPAAAQATVDPNVPGYQKVEGLSGNLKSLGSDTLQDMTVGWMEGFKKLYPSVTTNMEAPGSSAAPAALIEGTTQVGPMSRKMKPEEEDAFVKKHGFAPTRVSVALDCLAVFVNKDNPVRGLTLPQIDCIFSSTRNSGYRDIKTWGQAGLTGDWADMPISLYGRNSASGTYAFFKKHALFAGDFKPTVKEQPGSAAVVRAVGADRAAIGYSGIGYKTSGVLAIPLAKDHQSKLLDPTFENALSGDYPLGRALYIYVAKEPGKPLPPLVQEYLKYILSKEGQQIVADDGFGPLPPAAVQAQLELLE